MHRPSPWTGRAQEHGTLPDDEQRLIDPDGDGDVDPIRVQPSD